MAAAWFGRYSATICLGNKNYSAWSMRAWLSLRWSGMEAREVVVPMRVADWDARVAPWSPTHRVPALHLQPTVLVDETSVANDKVDGGAVVIHDSLAIAHTAFAAGLHHGDPLANAGCATTTQAFAFHGGYAPEHAGRGMALACEMHSGFPVMREHMPFNIRRMQHPQPKQVDIGLSLRQDLDRELQRLQRMWQDCRVATAVSARKQQAGDWHGATEGELPPFLLGAQPTLADLMFVPVATRFVAYDLLDQCDDDTMCYFRGLLGPGAVETGLPDTSGGVLGVAEFMEAALLEEWTIPDFEGH